MKSNTNMNDQNNIIPIAPRKKKKSQINPPNKASIEANELGEITIENRPKEKSNTPWQYRFLMYMIAFLLITLLLTK